MSLPTLNFLRQSLILLICVAVMNVLCYHKLCSDPDLQLLNIFLCPYVHTISLLVQLFVSYIVKPCFILLVLASSKFRKIFNYLFILTCISTGKNDMLISLRVVMHLAAYDFDKLSNSLSGQAENFQDNLRAFIECIKRNKKHTLCFQQHKKYYLT